MLRSRRALAWLALALSLSCERTNASHCGNNRGDATCMARSGSRPYCSVCEAANDGCMATFDARPGCAASPMIAGSESGSSTESTGVASTSETGAGETGSGSGLPGSSSSTEVGSSSVVESESSTGEPPPLCGDGIIEGDEICEGSDLMGATCNSIGLGAGELRCGDDCRRLDPSDCEGFGLTCGDNEIQGLEQCDDRNDDREDGDYGGQTCQSATGREGGYLQCDDCVLNTTECCSLPLALCSADAQCCSGRCLLVCGA